MWMGKSWRKRVLLLKTPKSNSLQPLKFGCLSIWPPFVAAPIAGYTDGVYREILREHGCPFCFTEMISAKGLVMGGPATLALVEHSPKDRPLAVQLFGSDPDDMFRAVEKLRLWGCEFDAIDINMGCPARKVTSQGAGGALLKDTSKAVQIVRAVKSASSLPVSAKMRIGWTDASAAFDTAFRLQDAGVDMLVVHGRTVAQGYSGEADWNVISTIAAQLKVPVVGNGDVVSPEEGLARISTSGCSGVMIARGMLGNPFFFENLCELLSGIGITSDKTQVRFEIAKSHLFRAAARYGERRAVLEMKKHLAFYFKGMKGASRLRVTINNSNTLGELCNAIESFSNIILGK